MNERAHLSELPKREAGATGPSKIRSGMEAGVMKQRLSALFLRTLERLSLELLVPRRLSCHERVLRIGDDRVRLSDYRRVVVIALGKAAFPMIDLLFRMLPPELPCCGVASGVGSDHPEVASVAFFHGGHPYPNRQSVKAGEAVVEMLAGTGAEDLVIFLLSGGGSAMCEKPLSPTISLDDLHKLNRLLVTCGANVLDVNDVRKHLSGIKGGRLAELAHPARQLTLYVSDAPPGHPSNVASGPTMPDESTVNRCYKIISRLGLQTQLPDSVRQLFDAGALPETPKADSPCFQDCSWHCLADPEDALQALVAEARDEGWVAEADRHVDDDCPLERATTHLLSRLEPLRLAHPGRAVAVLASGEFSCPVFGPGVGGRNQAFVLDCVARIRGNNIAVLSAGTDGIDGNSRAAGAVADGYSMARASALGLSPRAYATQSDSNTFFSRLGDALVTSPTGNNLRDLRILVAW